MLKSKKLRNVAGVVLAAVMMLSLISYAAQNGGGPGAGGPGAAGGGRQARGGQGGFNREDMQKRMMDMYKETLGADDESWTVIEPRLSKVMELQQSSAMGGGRGGMMRGMGGRGGMMGGQRRGGNRDGATSDAEQSAVEKATEALQTALEKPDVSSDDIKVKLAVLRKAREKDAQELAKARQSLREVLSLKQEAQLVLMGMLE